MGAKVVRIDLSKKRKLAEDRPKMLSISEIITQDNEAAAKMGRGNPHRLLLLHNAYALRQLVDRLGRFEEQEQLAKEGDAAPKIVLTDKP